MGVSLIHSRAQRGIAAPLVTVEVHLSNGLPALSIVGLPEAEVRESKERVRSALLNTSFDYPQRRITINLAPADLPKEGARFDLPIALGILCASNQIPAVATEKYEFVGELALTGELRQVHGALPAALAAERDGHALVVPAANAAEAALIQNSCIHGARHLLEVCAHLRGTGLLPRQPATLPCTHPFAVPDLAEVRGQAHAKRALEIAAAGAHNLLMIGPPGSGKTMLAQRLPGLLPPMTSSEALESAAIASISHAGLDAVRWCVRPFRAPHHTASAVALVGGGQHPRPGEVSLAHAGVLFLDELPEFGRRVLEALREPLACGSITVSRAALQTEFPAAFQLIAAMNPCPCGWLGDARGRCSCTLEQVRRYRARISGPLLDRIDLHVEVPPVSRTLLFEPGHSGPTSQDVRQRVSAARERQLARSGGANARLAPRDIVCLCALTTTDQTFLENAAERLNLSMRSVHGVLKVARTIADLEDEDRIGREQLAEALAYRRLERYGMSGS